MGSVSSISKTFPGRGCRCPAGGPGDPSFTLMQAIRQVNLASDHRIRLLPSPSWPFALFLTLCAAPA